MSVSDENRSHVVVIKWKCNKLFNYIN